MARRLTASCRLCRREGEKLFLKGTRCNSDKCAVARREYAPGQHGQRRSRKPSDYALQLREKQKAKRIYGLLEKQFRNYFKKAEKAKGVTGEVLLQELERRLDNVIYRANFAESRSKARQIVKHRFPAVNGKTVDIPSYQVKEGDEIVLNGSDEQKKAFIETTKILEDRTVPEWMEVSADNLALKVLRLPEKKDIGMAIEENLIVELYSK
ncbi:MAG: 30S ribosomal protein S4 [Candidatus Omnitrophica bacterium]|nr:30S ribosomal protein S4 [Candidatus Omnitrophota bacterium]